MIALIFLGILLFFLGVYSGIRINRWSNDLNSRIIKENQIRQDNEIFNKLLSNVITKKTKFKTRVNNTIYLGTKIESLGKVEIVYLMDRRDIAIFQDQKCIVTSENIKRETIEEISNTIDRVHEDKINDIVDVLGLVFSREDFEKTFNINIEDIKKQSKNYLRDVNSDKSDIEKIISENKQKFDIDEILDKISKVGIENLTIEERNFLDNFNK